MCTYDKVLQICWSSVGSSIMMTPSFVGVVVDNWQFLQACLFNEMLGHLVDDSFWVNELQKHRARWEGAVFIFC